MRKTNAQKQRDYRARVARRLAERHAEIERLTAERNEARNEAARLREDLDAALEECERLRATACRHPSQFVEGTHCHACGGEAD